MRNVVIVLSITIALLVGCVVGSVGTQLVVPPAKAATSPTRWEYYFTSLEVGRDRENTQKLNKIGAQGWELTNVQGLTVYFKRPAD